MKIKLGQYCVLYTSPSYWVSFAKSNSIYAIYKGPMYYTSKHVLRIDAIQSQLLKEIANEN